MLRFRSDEQLIALFRAGHDDAFRAIHDRYQKRLLAYARQMLPRRQDAEDALQDVFVRAYAGLRSSDGEFALRAWLFRVAHNRCIDELRRPAPPPPEVLALMRPMTPDPIAEVDLRESLRRLLEDVRRLPEQQRSALLMRELGGMSYADLACSLEISIPAVKSLLVRARLSLARAAEARDTACSEIRTELMSAHDRGVRPSATARRHIRDCSGCRCFRRELRGMTRQLAALTPAAGPLGVLANLLGLSGGAGGGATAGGATAGGGVAAVTGGGAAASAGGLALGSTHVATLIVAAVATAGGAAEIQHTLAAPPHHRAHVRPAAVRHHSANAPATLEQSVAAQSAGEPASSPPVTISEAVKAPTVKQAVTTTTGGAPALKRKLRSTGGARPSDPRAGTGDEAKTGTTTSSTTASGTGVCASPTTSTTAGTSSTGAGTSGSTSASTGTSTGASDGSLTGSSTASSTGTPASAGTTECTAVLTQGSNGESSSNPSQTSGATTSSSGTSSASGSSTGSGSGTSGTGSGTGTGTSTTGSPTSSSSPDGSSV